MVEARSSERTTPPVERIVRLLCLGACLVLAAACSGTASVASQPTPQVIYITPPPQPSPGTGVTPGPQPTPQLIYVTPQPIADSGSESPGPSADLLYLANDAEAFDEWTLGSDWAPVSGQLASRGEGDMRCSPLADCGALATSPFEPSSTDYVVDAEIRVVKDVGSGICMVCFGSWYGVVVRGSDEAIVVGYDLGAKSAMLYDWGTSAAETYERRLDLAPGWHTFRVAVAGSDVILSVDGKQVFDHLDNTSLVPGFVGLVDNGVQISVRSFRVSPVLPGS